MRLGWPEILICVVVLFFLFGAKKIPDLARSLGKAKGEFKKGLTEGEKEAKEAEEANTASADIEPEPKKIEKA